MATTLLPPLSAIRAFEAAARLSSFTRAAEELGMTQAAISYQIKLLEERAGAPLFLRRPRQIELSEAGRRLAPSVAEAFALLRDGWASVRSDAAGVLAISTLATFASNWLAQNLGAFQIAHPSIAVRLETSNKIVDFAREEVDVAIRSGSGDWPGMETHMLFTAGFTPMVSPALLRKTGPIETPLDLLRMPLLDPQDPWWRDWFDAAGVASGDLADRAGISLGAQSYEARAAMAGRGVAILTRALFNEEVAAGSLTQPFDLVVDDGNAYWLVYPTERRNVPKIRAFRDWLLRAVKASLGAA